MSNASRKVRRSRRRPTRAEARLVIEQRKHELTAIWVLDDPSWREGDGTSIPHHDEASSDDVALGRDTGRK